MGRYETRDPRIESILKDLGKVVKNMIPKGWGFSLWIFSYGEKGNLFYISSANRQDVVKMMKEFIAKEESTLDVVDGHTRGGPIAS